MPSPKISEMPPAERPRERLVKHGAAALKLSELVAILLRTGVKGQSALELAEVILAKFGTLEALSRATVAQLAQFKGVGRTKAIQLAAAFALGARLSQSLGEGRDLDSPERIYEMLRDEMRLLAHEEVRVLLLNTKMRLISMEVISKGLLNSSLLHAREMFRPAILQNAHAVVLVHNHPSGDPRPSAADLQITRQMRQTGELLEIKLHDHVIIGVAQSGRKGYFSFMENGCL